MEADCPLVSEIMIRRQAESKINAAINNQKRTLISVLCNNLRSTLVTPSIDDLMAATKSEPCDWIPLLPQCEGQSNDSYIEQQKSLKIGIKRIRLYLRGRLKNHLCLVGPPGSGKTMITQILSLHAISQGLNVAVTSLPSEQSRLSGGQHLHILFHINTHNSKYSHPMMEASDCIRKLSKNEVSCALLAQTDVIVFEEIGLVSSELYSIPDTAMKFLMKNDLKMGGKLVIANGDHFQLQAINGSSIWLSTHMLFSYDVMLLEHYVRSRSDSKLQELLELMRKLKLTSKDMRKASKIIKENCNFIKSWDDAPTNAIRIVPKRKAVRNVTSDYLKAMRQNTNIRFVEAIAADQCQIEDRWDELGNASHSRILDRCAYEVKTLIMYEGAVGAMTSNHYDHAGRQVYSQGQLCIIKSIPDPFINQSSSVTVTLAPPGTKDLSNPLESWRDIEIRSRPSNAMVIGSNCLQGRRIQYPVIINVSMTMHKVVGKTLPCVAIQLLADKEFELWEREQFTVEISRCPTLSCIYIVGSKRDVHHRLTEILSIENEVMEKIVKRINELNILKSHVDEDEDDEEEIARENAMSFFEVSYTAPETGFIYHAIYADALHHSYLNVANSNIEKQIRHDNNGVGYKAHAGQRSELYGFIYGFTSRASRNDILESFLTQLGIDNSSSILESPWSIRARMIGFINDFNGKFENENLKYVSTADLNQQVVIAKAAEVGVAIVERHSPLGS